MERGVSVGAAVVLADQPEANTDTSSAGPALPHTGFALPPRTPEALCSARTACCPVVLPKWHAWASHHPPLQPQRPHLELGLRLSLQLSLFALATHHAQRASLDHDAHDFVQCIRSRHGGVLSVGVICGLKRLCISGVLGLDT
ncbi:unnamed protein product [Discula destructiva]